MIFDLGCCCNISTGNYDLYGGMPAFTSISLEKLNIFAKTPSHAEELTQYYHNPGANDIPVYAHSSGERNITNFIYGKYVPMISSGIDLRYANSPNLAIAVPAGNSEMCWVVRRELLKYAPEDDIRMLYDALNGTGAYYNGISSGTGVSYDSSGTITLITNENTSGAYINIPITDTGALTYLTFDVNPSYDKTILLRLEGDPSYSSTYPSSGYEIWLKGEINPLNLVSRSYYISQSGSGTINPSWWRPTIGMYQYTNLTGTATGDYLHYYIKFNMPTYDSSNPIYMDSAVARRNDITGYPIYNNIQIRMVDNTGARSIDDISGFQLKISNLDIGMTQRSLTTGIREEDIYDEFDNYLYTLSETGYFVLTAPNYVDFKDIILFDIENDRMLYRRSPNTGNVLGGDVFNTDYGKKFNITGLYQPTGYLREMDLIGNIWGEAGVNDNSTYGTWFYGLSDRNTQRSKYNYRTWEKITYTGSASSLIKYIVKHKNNNQVYESCISRDGSKIAFINMESQFSDNYLGGLTATVDYSTGNLQPALYEYYDNILEYDTGNGLTFRFGEAKNMVLVNYIWGLANYQAYGNLVFGAPNTQYSSIDLDTVNSGYNIPCIEKFCSYDYPKCFSVKNPKDKYVYIEGGSESIQSIEDTIQILFGDMVERTYTVQLRVGNSSGWGHLPVTPYSPSSFSDLLSTGYVADVDVRLIHGDPSGTIFWEDTHTADRGGTLIHGGGTTGIFRYNNTVSNVGARVLYGDCYNGEIPGAIFVHGRYTPAITPSTGVSHLGTEATNSASGSGVAYCKVRIGNNTVFDTQVYSKQNLFLHDDSDNPPQFYRSGFMPAFGLTALHPTESAQTISGSGAAFVWFETLFSGAPSFSNTGMVPITGYKMHVTNTSGNDLWTMQTSRYALTGTGTFGSLGSSPHPLAQYMLANKPRVSFSSDRFFYVSNFIINYPGIWMGETSMRIRTTGQIFDGGLGRYTKLDATGEVFQVKPQGVSGAGDSWAFSHNGLAIMPVGHYSDECGTITYYESGGYADASGNFGASTRYFPYPLLRFETHPIEAPYPNDDDAELPRWTLNRGEKIYYDCIKRSDRHDDAPAYSPWVYNQSDLTGVQPKYWDFFGETSASGIIGSGII